MWASTSCDKPDMDQNLLIVEAEGEASLARKQHIIGAFPYLAKCTYVLSFKRDIASKQIQEAFEDQMLCD
jgi:hypothetical protein